MSIQDMRIHIERVDDIPVVYGLLQKMGIQANIDRVIEPHGQGLSPSWVITIWLLHSNSRKADRKRMRGEFS